MGYSLTLCTENHIFCDGFWFEPSCSMIFIIIIILFFFTITGLVASEEKTLTWLLSISDDELSI